MALGVRVVSNVGNNWDEIISLGASESPSGLHLISNEIASGDTVSNLLPSGQLTTLTDVDRDASERRALMESFFQAFEGNYFVFTGAGTGVAYRGIWQDGDDLRASGKSLGQYLMDKYSITEGNLWNDGSNVDVWFILKGSMDSSQLPTVETPDNHFPSLCNNSTFPAFQYDDANDEILVWVAGDYYTIATGITSQTDVKTWFEGVYPDDNYLFAYHPTTGDICVDWQDRDVGNGNFTYSVELEENIQLDDEVAAWVVSNARATYHRIALK